MCKPNLPGLWVCRLLATDKLPAKAVLNTLCLAGSNKIRGRLYVDKKFFENLREETEHFERERQLVHSHTNFKPNSQKATGQWHFWTIEPLKKSRPM